MGIIFDTLEAIGMTSKESREVFSKKTKDFENLVVYRDKVSGVIYIDDYITGNDTYRNINYTKSRPDYERDNDSVRRLRDFKKYYLGKNICDIGCGEGLFLKGAQDLAQEVCGVEIQEACKVKLLNNGIKCNGSVAEFIDKFDTIFMFHSLEHFSDPLNILVEARKKLNINGRVVIEVPHANDFLIKNLKCDSFIDFTLWSQHLILHTRESLMRLLSYAGFKNITIQGKQRYPLSNHLYWLANNEKGGHISTLSIIDNNVLYDAYENTLRSIDATDTIIAVAEL